MGFGYLFLGYLVSFVISLTLKQLDVGGLAYLLGFALMLRGLLELERYQRAFSSAKWLCYPILAVSAYSLFASFNTMFLWGLPIFEASVTVWVDAANDILLMLFQVAMLFGIRMLARDVELLHIATKAIRNSLFVVLYALLYLVAHLPRAWVSSFVAYVVYAQGIVLLVLVACNLFLLLSCNKNICAAGDEDQPPRQSRFRLINRMNDAYDQNRQRNIDNAKRDAEEFVRRRREKKEQRNKKK